MFRRLPGQAQDYRLKNHATEQTEPAGGANLCRGIYERHLGNPVCSEDGAIMALAQSSDSSATSELVATAPFRISIVGQAEPPEPAHYPEAGYNLRSLAYLQAEFPTEWPRVPNISSTMTHSLVEFFVSKLPEDPRIERVYWALEGTVVRIWTIIDHPDYEFEKSIYDAQLRFMDAFRELDCDFSVIYRLGKPIERFNMEGAMLVAGRR